MTKAATIVDLEKSFGSLHVLKGVSLEIDEGATVAIIGRSGSGKSTLLRCLNGLETIDSGQITIVGHRIPSSESGLLKLRHDVGIVFQQYNLFPHLTVEKNIMLGPKVVKRMSAAEARALARNALEQVGLSDKVHAFPDELSGGQQQRVAIARSLAMRPKVMLFDEVTSALDPELTGEVLKVLEDLAQTGMTMLLVTHEMAFARRFADRVIFMHSGRVWEDGRPEKLLEAPETPELKQFISSTLK
jgi:polar amino acid transport system ATP-binding protein